MNREEHKNRFALAVLVSFFVFVVIAAALGLSIIAIYLLLRMDIIDTIEGHLKFRDVCLFMSCISMTIGFAITMLTSKITLKPFNRIINQLNRLAKGDFQARLHFGKPITNHPAFKEIENSFNRAAEELGHTEMLRNDFINNFSHEFKTPIVSIAGFANLLRFGDLSQEETQEYLQVIEEESLRLSYMATNVLNLTKVENQKILTDVARYNLSEQLRSAVLLLADKWQQKDLKMDIDFGEHFIVANEELLKQVWINLLDNAVKFSPSEGTVCIKITEDVDKIYVAISNQGKEIPQDSLTRIFNKFYQADESHSSEGNGIGLAIVKKVTELHNAQVLVISEQGTTTFTVAIPRKPD